MDSSTQFFLIYILIPSVAGVGTWLVRNLLTRLDVLERTLTLKLDEIQVRQLLADKINPISDDIHELKDKLDTIYNLLLKQ